MFTKLVHSNLEVPECAHLKVLTKIKEQPSACESFHKLLHQVITYGS